MSAITTYWKGTVCYDGTGYVGWQRQDNGPTVQGELEAALSRIADRPVAIQGAGRTDSGVHAFGQVFSFEWPGEPPQRLRHAVSKMLGPRIRVTALEPAAPDFNARFSATGKTYRYAIDNAQEPWPLCARYAWHVPHKLDFALIESLLPDIEGTRDFGGFQSVGAQMKTNTVRTVHSVRLLRGEGIVTPAGYTPIFSLEYQGDGFLYKMVRNLTGTLIEIGRGRFEPDFIREQLAAGGPFLGHCAPPHGLAMMEVRYE